MERWGGKGTFPPGTAEQQRSVALCKDYATLRLLFNQTSSSHHLFFTLIFPFVTHLCRAPVPDCKYSPSPGTHLQLVCVVCAGHGAGGGTALSSNSMRSSKAGAFESGMKCGC